MARTRRIMRKPPRVIAQRLLAEARLRTDRYLAPRRARSLDERALVAQLGAADLGGLWQGLAARPYPGVVDHAGARACADALPNDEERILAAAEHAVARRIDLLGTGPVELGRPIDWHTDVKTGRRWEPAYAFGIEYAELDRPSDVKVPWEISRAQWLLPAGQAFLLTGDERYAEAVRDVLAEWIAGNPYAGSVNWACAMEPALRILTWTWLFHACSRSAAWSDAAFRFAFLRALYLHAEFVERNLEISDVNGNHYTADAAGLVVGGLFFGHGAAPGRWHALGWRILRDELPRQVHPDGVDFEASVPYHRLVAELFLLPARHRRALGLEVPGDYCDRLVGMARFSLAYTRSDGSSPLWGDADDARALPLGTQPLDDHRYLAEIVGLEWDVTELLDRSGEPASETLWAHGAERASRLRRGATEQRSEAFRDGGVFVLRGGGDHIFVDCGPIGLAGRGGHGHNDALSFEATLDGTLLLTDCGAFVYTASPDWRNAFRSTRSHNTPGVDGEEQNRFVRPDWLWSLHDDARPELLRFQADDRRAIFRGTHSGYARLREPVRPERTIAVDFTRHLLVVHDAFAGTGVHVIRIPFHLGPGILPTLEAPGRWRLQGPGRTFRLSVAGEWSVQEREAWRSPSYGLKEPIHCLELVREGELRSATVVVAPADADLDPERALAELTR